MKAPVEVQFAQKLASNEKTIRDRAVRKLKLWLGRRTAVDAAIDEEELMRLWKGLFYCYWMSDKPLVQEELADNIASMIDCIGSEKAALLFMKCFFLTMGREWFGIDRWRMDKFMMFTRRFLRQMLKYSKKRSWDSILVSKTSEIISDNLLLVDVSKTSLGLQLHIIDIFLEELAKVGGEKLPEEVLDTFLKPYYQLLCTNSEPRLKEHVVQRIFHHLIRQSDAGIAWEIRKDMESRRTSAMELEEEDSDQEEEEEDMDKEEEGETTSKAEDPRAGKVDVELPQLPVNYDQIAKKLFDIGSGPAVTKSNRATLYLLSKYFKDVKEEIFPLGDDLSDEEEVETIDVKKAAQKLLEREEKYKQRNEKKKQEYRQLVKERRKQERAEKLQQQMEQQGNDSEGDDGDEPAVMKRKMADDEEENSSEKRPRIDEEIQPKVNRKERERERKREMKRRKRERLQAEAARAKEEEERQQRLLEQDMEVAARLTAGESSADTALHKKKKNKKGKKLEATGKDSVRETVEAKSDFIQNEEISLGKKKKKKKDKSVRTTEEDAKSKGTVKTSLEEVVVKQQAVQKSSVEETLAVKGDQSGLVTPESKKKKKKKNKDKKSSVEGSPRGMEQSTALKAAVHFDPSPLTNLQRQGGKLFEESEDWDSPLLPGEQEIIIPNKKYKGNIKLAPPAPAVSESTEKQKKKKNKEMLRTVQAANVVAASKVVTTESVGAKSPSAAKPPSGFPGFDRPTVSTPNLAKSHTAIFLKKALSKSVTPKAKSKAGGSSRLEVERSASEPRPKKVNFVLTRNKSQDISEWASAIINSPGVPHDPSKNPEKSLLKKKVSLESSFTSLNPVQLNTQMNSRTSVTGLLLGKNRKQAKDFF